MPLYRQEAIFARHGVALSRSTLAEWIGKTGVALQPLVHTIRLWLFAGSETAGRRAAAIMSLLATAKANGLEPHAWLSDVLTRLPSTKDIHLDSLLPTSWYCPVA